MIDYCSEGKFAKTEVLLIYKPSKHIENYISIGATVEMLDNCIVLWNDWTCLHHKGSEKITQIDMPSGMPELKEFASKDAKEFLSRKYGKLCIEKGGHSEKSMRMQEAGFNGKPIL